MAVNGRMDWLYGLASTIFAENHENQYLVELYENELSAIISDLNPDTIVLENIGETEKMFANAFLEFDITAFEAYKQGMLDRFNFKDGEIQKAYMDYLDSDFKEVISALDDVKTGLKGVAMSVELANNLANGMCNYLNGIEIMAMVVESVDGGNNPEFRTAAMRLYSKYKSESLNILLSAMETFASECLEWSVDEIISAMASLASQTNSIHQRGYALQHCEFCHRRKHGHNGLRRHRQGLSDLYDSGGDVQYRKVALRGSVHGCPWRGHLGPHGQSTVAFLHICPPGQSSHPTKRSATSLRRAAPKSRRSGNISECWKRQPLLIERGRPPLLHTAHEHFEGGCPA